MRILILTFHKAYSYGACLQAYATLKYFENKGYEVAFIDYENAYEARGRNGKWIYYSDTKEKLKFLIKKIFFKYDEYGKRAYKSFHQMLPVVSMDEVHTEDIVAVGSDQTWNTNICNGLDLNFFLEPFGNNKKYSLAASTGGTLISEEQKKIVLPLLRDFDGISVREQFTKKQFEKFLPEKITVILDPTLWMPKSFWLETIKSIPQIKDAYILDFVFENTAIDSSKDIISQYKNILNLPIYRIMLNTFKARHVDETIKGATPFEFVRLIRDAKFVITNSFHGVAFSILLNTPFVFLPVNNNNNQRMVELLQKLELENRMVSDPHHLAPVMLDFTEANSRLVRERKDTERWLADNIMQNERRA